jgi:hypothetical protein
MLRCLRLDASDDFVFPRAGVAGEWAVSGAFMFDDPAALDRKEAIAFRSGFLCLGSFGWTTLVEVAEADAAAHEAALAALAAFLRGMGAPREAALAAAREELGFAESLCDVEPGTVIAVQRAEGRERFRTLHRRAGASAPVFGWVEEA